MQNMYYGGYQQPMDPNQYFGNPMMQNQIVTFNNQNALTNEEIQKLKNTRPSTTALNLNIDEDEMLRAMCTHKDNGRDVVQLVNDGSGDVYCPICGKRWNPTPVTKEEVQEALDKLISYMQNSTWVGEYPANVVREYFVMMPLLEKFPDLYAYGQKNFDRYLNQRGFYSAGDANVYGQYNSMFGPGMGYGAPIYQRPMYPQQPNMGYYQQPQVQPQPAAPNVNPMQQPVYGQPGYNPQFGDQANSMMGGTYYQQPGYGPGPQQFNPVYGNAAVPQQPQPQVAPQPAPQVQPQQPQAQAAPQQPATVTTDTKVEL